VDDRSSAVSLPETPLLGVLPERAADARREKKKCGRDLADLFLHERGWSEGRRAREWGLVDEIRAPGKICRVGQERAQKLVAGVVRKANTKGIR